MATTALGYAATAGAAFTTTQWKELERQAMIYKYMVASVPVPPHLLLPLSPSPPDSDPEAGRCKRTDGKKWRCSRDVAPHHKYCERHMHRGRPRSRKPVELSPAPTKKTRLHLPPPTTLSTPPPPSPRLLGSTLSGNKPSSLLPQDTSLSLYSNRGMDLMMEREMTRKEDASKQQLQDYMNGGFIYGSTASPSIFQPNYGDEQQLNSLSLPEIADSYNDFNLFLNPYDQPPRDFIDAWSNNNNLNSERNNNDDSSSANGNLSPCSLNLSMAMGVGNSLDDEMGEIQMGETNRETTNQRCQGLSWLSPVSWIDSEPGGPLAEVLRPSHLNFSSDPGYAGKNGDGSAISHPATSAPSSPSGVLHRTMLSLSDTSVCNSPTVVATSAGAGEIVGFPCLG